MDLLGMEAKGGRSPKGCCRGYTLVNGRPPAHSDIQRFFRLTPPTVHQMLPTLENAGLISRQPGVPRSIALLVERDRLPRLDPPDFNPANSL